MATTVVDVELQYTPYSGTAKNPAVKSKGTDPRCQRLLSLSGRAREGAQKPSGQVLMELCLDWSNHLVS